MDKTELHEYVERKYSLPFISVGEWQMPGGTLGIFWHYSHEQGSYTVFAHHLYNVEVDDFREHGGEFDVEFFRWIVKVFDIFIGWPRITETPPELF